MAYEISKHRILQHWNDRKLTHTSDWDEIDLTSLKRAGETTTAHMEHLIKNAWVTPCQPWQYYIIKDTQQLTSYRDVA